MFLLWVQHCSISYKPAETPSYFNHKVSSLKKVNAHKNLWKKYFSIIQKKEKGGVEKQKQTSQKKQNTKKKNQKPTKKPQTKKDGKKPNPAIQATKPPQKTPTKKN